MTDALSPPETKEEPLSAARVGPVLAVLLSATFITQFDFFVVNVAAPSLETDLGASSSALELIVGGYAFAYAGGMITGGRLGDMYGHRRLFVIGVLGFAFASLLCGVTANPEQLVAARLAQGLTGALMAPQVLAVVTADFPDALKPKAMAGYGVAAGLGSIAGQVLGGAMIEADLAGLGWRLIFLVNVPYCLLVALLAPGILPSPRSRHRTTLDPVGAVGVATALALLLVPLTMGHSQGWPAWTWISMACAVPVGAAVMYGELLLNRRDASPVLDLGLFRSPSFRAGIIASVAFMLYFGSFMFTLTLLLQSGLGLDAFEAGLVFSPMGVTFMLTSVIGGRLTDRFGVIALVVSSAVTAAGLLMLAAPLYSIGDDTSVAWVVICLCLIGAGNGVVLPALFGAALMRVQPRKAGIASGILTTTQQFASSAGVAVIGAVFFAVAGDAPNGDDYSDAMARATAISVLLVIAVMWMTWTFKRLADEPKG
ncbi:MFS transporter [Wenjunlia vitaminophila]|uniref:MFS transporter n=2 Tax=Wenjunlia vitaminophila TaxID=76728 RepID=A0A0T6LQ17_WENVI|nr:MFS transporter [Wenjunlia vitaminophila]